MTPRGADLIAYYLEVPADADVAVLGQVTRRMRRWAVDGRSGQRAWTG
jgi:hypothetical protein